MDRADLTVLVLTRSIGQVIEIMGDLVKVEVLQIDGDRVRLGFTAPPEIDIVRSEAKLKTRKP